jgi:multidrug resistance efflux pump
LWVGRTYQDFRVNRAQQREAEQAANEAAQVKTYRVRPRENVWAFKRIGTIRARAETNLQFGAPGRINKVRRGKRPVRSQRSGGSRRWDQSEARNALAVAALEFDKANIKYFRDGTIDRLSFEQAKARYQQAKLEVDKTVIRAGHDGYLG